MSNDDSRNYDQALSVWNLSEEKESAEEGCGVFSIFNVNPGLDALDRHRTWSMSDMQLNIYAEHGILQEKV